MVLENQLTMANLVHRDYSKEFVKVGDSITIRKPARFSAKNFTGQVHSQNITEGSAVVKMDRFRDVTVEVGAKELTLDIKDFSTQVVAPALSAIAQAIDQDLLAVTEYKVTGTADDTKLNVTEGKPEAGTIAAGDQLIVNGYTYTVTEALTLTGGAGTLKVDQNLPADIETATPVKVINKQIIL